MIRVATVLRATLLILSLATVYLLTANFTLQQSYDSVSAALPAWQLAHHHNLDMTAFRGWSDWIIRVDDHWVSNRFPGVIAFAAPFYLFAGSGVEAPAMWPAALAAVTTVTAAVVLLHRSLRVIAPTLALPMAAAFALGTPAWSVAADALWTHGPALLALSIAVLGLSHRRPVLTLIGLGLAVTCRPHLAVPGLVIALFMALTARSRAERLLPGVGLTTGIAALIGYNRFVYGHWTVMGGYDGSNANIEGVGLRDIPLNVLGAFVSPSRGLLLYTPLVLVLLPFVVAGWRQTPPWGKAAAISGLVYLATQLYLVRFSGGNRFYSYRVSLEALFLCWPLLTAACALVTRGPARRVLAGAASLSVATTAVGATTNYISSYEIRPWGQLDLVLAWRQLTPANYVLLVVVTAAVLLLWTHELPSSRAPGVPRPWSGEVPLVTPSAMDLPARGAILERHGVAAVPHGVQGWRRIANATQRVRSTTGASTSPIGLDPDRA